jgi:tetratricopeptide (TPR) repeat protein
MSALLFVLMYIAGFNGAAAQTANQQQCPASNPDLSISGCTAMILSGRETPGNLAEAFYNRGVAYDNKGQPDRAIEDYDQAIRLNPNHAKAFYNRGVAYAIKRQHDRAIEDFDHVIGLNPDDASAFVGRGAAYTGKGVTACRPASFLPPCALAIAQYDRAIEDFDQAIRLNPNDATSYRLRSITKSVKGDSDGAVADLAKAQQLSSSVGK